VPNYLTATSLSWVLCRTILQPPHYPEFCAELSYSHLTILSSVPNYLTATSLSWVLCRTILQSPHYPEFCAELSYSHLIILSSVPNYLTATSLSWVLCRTILQPPHYLEFCAELSYSHLTILSSVPNYLTAISLPAVPLQATIRTSTELSLHCSTSHGCHAAGGVLLRQHAECWVLVTCKHNPTSPVHWRRCLAFCICN